MQYPKTHQFGVDFELPEVMPEEPMLREQYLIPALTAVAARLAELRGGKVIEPELPKAVERAEIIHDFDGLPYVRFVAAWTYVNRGTEDEPDWQLIHLGRVDVIVEDESPVNAIP